ncbi:MAG TPA: cytochrome c nitrite reductase small subunit [Aggregatilineales bacterium]|nr:cytochrome c nitrite reductase small subunit [Anaerolineae bacterium]HUN08478.1 cytochrome c nitrite reductase small subunit [Aggregatilineales bacterium]
MKSFLAQFRSNTRWQVAFLVAVVGVPIGLGLFTFNYAKGTSYLSDDPQACMNCHIMRDQFEAWQRSSHARVATCNSCHTPHTTLVEKYVVKGINGFNHSVAFTTGNFHEPIRITQMNADVVQASCVHCHEPMVEFISTNHQDETLACVTCHNDVGHDTRN